MNTEILIFCEIRIDELKFHYSKNSVLTNHVGIDKSLICNVSQAKESYKYFIGYKDDDYSI